MGKGLGRNGGCEGADLHLRSGNRGTRQDTDISASHSAAQQINFSWTDGAMEVCRWVISTCNSSPMFPPMPPACRPERSSSHPIKQVGRKLRDANPLRIPDPFSMCLAAQAQALGEKEGPFSLGTSRNAFMLVRV